MVWGISLLTSWYTLSVAKKRSGSSYQPGPIAKRLRAAREEARLDQGEIGDRLGMSRAGYGHFETGRVVPDVEVIERIAAILHRPLEYFLGLDTDLSEDEGELLALYRAIEDARDKKLALNMLRDLVAR